MGHFLTCKIPISETVCTECKIESKDQRIAQGNLNMIYNIPISSGDTDIPNKSFSVKIDVRKIKWKRECVGSYFATAQMFVICPKCDKLHEIEQIFEAPKIYLEQSRTCEKCGGSLTFQEEELDIEDRNGKPYITMSGKLICEKCQMESSLSVTGEVSPATKENSGTTYVVACGKGQELHIKM